MKIRLDKQESFDDRMEFDIYKRQTKHKRYKSLWEKQKQKLPKEKLESRFSRLFEDASRRKFAKQRIEESSDFTDVQSGSFFKTNTPKLLNKDFTKIYERNIEKMKIRDEKILEQQKIKEYKEENEIILKKALDHKKAKEFYEKHMAYSTKDSPRLVDNDIKRRKMKYKILEDEKKCSENLEVIL